MQKAQHGRRAPRAWQVGIGTATPAELGQLMGLMHGLYGPPPWVYVGPWAQVTNLLPPAASMLLPGSWSGAGVSGGTVTLEGGTRPSYSVLSDTGAELRLPAVPVVAGVPVTGSVWGAGSSGCSIHLDFRNATGATLSTASASHAAAVGGPLPRRSVTGTPPAESVDAVLRVTGALRAAQPAVTWTPDMAAWAAGGGAPKVVARGLSEAVQLAVRDEAYLRRSSASFVLEEVGNA
ncbi:hypothetical protein [Arthrobacter burdickii]|uniref:Uncharacterized protein n=1 Tax=Arthrobacter burdickii TaxID=3035920 RepID=A0ABT8K608_9MICC|nr:hypothetical protein [Arthrobacter burdickii]MDN4611957.1 hypothetical protein [Arthrobacter burdickii]